jgi:hypothetical protein
VAQGRVWLAFIRSFLHIHLRNTHTHNFKTISFECCESQIGLGVLRLRTAPDFQAQAAARDAAHNPASGALAHAMAAPVASPMAPAAAVSWLLLF